MAINIDDVHKISNLARLPLDADMSDREEAELVDGLVAIIGYFDQLSQYDADPEPLVAASTDSHEAPDVPGQTLRRELFEANAPEAREGFLVVPKVKSPS